MKSKTRITKKQVRGKVSSVKPKTKTRVKGALSKARVRVAEKQDADPVYRREIMLVFEAVDSNPNGDPDNGGMPREYGDGHGFVTDVCIKRWWRDAFVEAVHGGDDSCLYVRKGATRAAQETDVAVDGMFDSYNDLQAFGGILGMHSGKKGKGKSKETQVQDDDAGNKVGKNSLGITGPFQVQLAKSVAPISILEIPISACIAANAGKDKNQGLGRKYVVKHAVYVAHAYLTPSKAYVRLQDGTIKQVINEDAVEKWINVLPRLFEFNKATSRTGMRMREVLVFKHRDPRGSGQSQAIFDKVRVQVKSELPDGQEGPLKWEDYKISVNIPGSSGFVNINAKEDRGGLSRGSTVPIKDKGKYIDVELTRMLC